MTESAISEKWKAAIQPFATRLGKTVEEVTTAILATNIIASANDSSAEIIVDADSVKDEDFTRAFPNEPVATLRKAIKDLREAAKPATTTATAMAAASRVTEVLAQLPSGESVLTGLSVAQVGKIERETVYRGIQVALAAKAGLYEVPRVVLHLMEDFVTNRMEEPAPKAYYDLEAVVARQDNAEVLKALEIDGRYVSQDRKREFVKRIELIWPAVRDFANVMERWYESYTKAAGNPLALMQLLSAAVSGSGAFMPTAIATPDTSGLYDAAQTVVQAINKAFAGRVVPAALALAFDAERINKLLSNPEIIRFTGATNREDLVRIIAKELKSALVTPEYRRLETGLGQYVLSVYELDKHAQPGAPKELQYIAALYQLGQSVSWEKVFGNVGGSSESYDPTPIGGRRNGAEAPRRS